jgi:ubiquinone/menaquinone biosynthesis C-methylase UbiE
MSVTDANMPALVRYGQPLVGRLSDTIVPLLPFRIANLLQTRLANWNDYYREAEDMLEEQWNEIIWPLIKDFDFGTVLELSPGAGRNTEKLSKLASRLIVVDYCRDPLNRTRARLGTNDRGCEISYHRNNGSDLPMVPDESVTAIYCWDAAVHFEKSVMLSYIREFARVLKPGASGFVHHSTLGDPAHKNIKRNPDWRSNVSKELVANACQANGLTVTMQQRVPWKWTMQQRVPLIATVDCATVFCKGA